MAKEQKARGRGRPPVAKPKTLQLNVRIDQELRDAIEAFMARRKDDLGLSELSDAARYLLRRGLRSEG